MKYAVHFHGHRDGRPVADRLLVDHDGKLSDEQAREVIDLMTSAIGERISSLEVTDVIEAAP